MVNTDGLIEFIKQYWLQTLFTGIVAGLSFAVKKLFGRMKKEFDEQARIKSGVVAILRDRLYQSCQFYIKQGYLSVSDMENIDNLYKSYHDLGGNGIGKELYNRIKQLEIENK